MALKAVGGSISPIQGIEIAFNGGGDLIKLPFEIKSAVADWKSVDWSNGTSVLSASIQTAETMKTAWALIEVVAKFSSNDTFVDVMTSYINLAPALNVAIYDMKVMITVDQESADLANAVSNLATALEHANWEDAGSAIGVIYHDILEMKNTAAGLKVHNNGQTTPPKHSQSTTQQQPASTRNSNDGF